MGSIRRTLNTIIQLLIFVSVGALILASPFCLLYYNTFSYQLDFIGILASPVIVVIVFLIYSLLTLVYTILLITTRMRAPELELDAYMHKRSKDEIERQHLLTNEHNCGIIEDPYSGKSQVHLNVIQHFFIDYVKVHNIVALVLLLIPLVFALVISCYYYAPFNPIKARTIKPYQSLADWNASESMQVIWNKDKSRDNKLLLFKGNHTPTDIEMANLSYWDQIVPAANSNQRYAVLTNLTPTSAYYYYVPSFAEKDELYVMTMPSVDAYPTIAIIADIDSSPLLNKLLNKRLKSTNPNLTIILGNMVKYGLEEAEWLLFMQAQGIFNYFRSYPVVALPGAKESKEPLFSPKKPRYFYSLIFYDPQVLSKSRDNQLQSAQEKAFIRKVNNSTKQSLIQEPRMRYTEDDLKYIPEHLRDYYKEEELIPSHNINAGAYRYYIYGNTTLILLDSFQEQIRVKKHGVRSGSFLTVAQVNWLVSVLETEAVQKTAHRILFVQVPFYSKGEKGGAPLLAELLEPLICKYRIAAVFTADSRLYEVYRNNKTCPMNGINHTFVHVTIGSGGAPPASMMSAFLGRRQWKSLEYIENSNQELQKYPARIYAKVGFTYATLSFNESLSPVVVAYDIVTGKELHRMALTT